MRDRYPGVPMMALTATAAPRVRTDILHQLGMKNTKWYNHYCSQISTYCTQIQLRTEHRIHLVIVQGGHGTGKTGNLAVNFSRQGKHREFSKFNFLHRENGANTGEILKI